MTETLTAEKPTVLTETYGEWVVRCVTPKTTDGANSVRVCEMTQELRHRASNKKVLSISVQAGEKGPGLVFVGPFGLLLSEGMKLNLGDKTLLKMDFRTCLPSGCVAVAELKSAQINALKAGEAAHVVMMDTNNQALQVAVPLDGFADAWKRVKQLVSD